MRGIDHDHVHAGLDQRLTAFEPRVAHGRGRGDTQAPEIVLAGRGVEHRGFGVLEREKPRQLAVSIGDQQLLDAPRLHQALGLVAIGRFAKDRKAVAGHHHAHRRRVILGKAHVAIGDDPHDAPRLVDHRKAGDAVAFLQRLGIGERLVGAQGDGIVDDTGFEPLDAAHLAGLILDGEIAVNDPHATRLRHADGHARLGHGVHRRTQQRNVEVDGLGDPRAGVGGAGQHVRCRGHQQNVIKGERLANLHSGSPWISRLARPYRMDGAPAKGPFWSGAAR